MKILIGRRAVESRIWGEFLGGGGGFSRGGRTTKKDTSVMIHVCHSRSRFLSCMYIHDDFMTESR